MKILHYFLGFPPYRSGGLTAYCMELMSAQKNNGDEVVGIWPGRMSFCGQIKTSIKKQKANNGIENYEIINPLPVPLDEGISECLHYMKVCNADVYELFLQELKPDVIHVHTLMGLHRELVESANKLKIKIVFTSHDYFGLCPKVTLYRDGQICTDNKDCSDCIRCNQTALSIKKIKLLQSPMYRSLKNNRLVKKLRSMHRKGFYGSVELPPVDMSDMELQRKKEEYKKLQSYYIDMLCCMDEIHFNSTVSKKIYEKYMQPKKSRVISITREDILDNRNIEHKDSDIVRITYLATMQSFKGYSVLIQALDSLWEEGFRGFRLNLFNVVDDVKPYMNVREEGFQREELSDVFADTDILLAPSVWYETFGFTVLEALSHGVPVIVSENVGSKDIIGEGGIVVAPGDVEQLKDVLKGLDKDKLQTLREGVLKLDIKTMDKHLQECYELYKED